MKKMKVDYDYEFDNLLLYLSNEKYEYSEFLNDLVAVEFNTDRIPFAVEISEASEMFKVKKQYLNSIKGGEINILIGENYIKVSIELYVDIHNKTTLVNPLSVTGDNDFNVPNFKANIAIA